MRDDSYKRFLNSEMYKEMLGDKNLPIDLIRPNLPKQKKSRKSFGIIGRKKIQK